MTILRDALNPHDKDGYGHRISRLERIEIQKEIEREEDIGFRNHLELFLGEATIIKTLVQIGRDQFTTDEDYEYFTRLAGQTAMFNKPPPLVVAGARKLKQPLFETPVPANDNGAYPRLVRSSSAPPRFRITGSAAAGGAAAIAAIGASLLYSYSERESAELDIKWAAIEKKGQIQILIRELYTNRSTEDMGEADFKLIAYFAAEKFHWNPSFAEAIIKASAEEETTDAPTASPSEDTGPPANDPPPKKKPRRKEKRKRDPWEEWDIFKDVSPVSKPNAATSDEDGNVVDIREALKEVGDKHMRAAEVDEDRGNFAKAKEEALKAAESYGKARANSDMNRALKKYAELEQIETNPDFRRKYVASFADARNDKVKPYEDKANELAKKGDFLGAAEQLREAIKVCEDLIDEKVDLLNTEEFEVADNGDVVIRTDDELLFPQIELDKIRDLLSLQYNMLRSLQDQLEELIASAEESPGGPEPALRKAIEMLEDAADSLVRSYKIYASNLPHADTNPLSKPAKIMGADIDADFLENINALITAHQSLLAGSALTKLAGLYERLKDDAKALSLHKNAENILAASAQLFDNLDDSYNAASALYWRADAAINRGRLLFKAGRYKDGAEEIKNAIEANLESLDRYAMGGSVHHLDGIMAQLTNCLEILKNSAWAKKILFLSLEILAWADRKMEEMSAKHDIAARTWANWEKGFMPQFDATSAASNNSLSRKDRDHLEASLRYKQARTSYLKERARIYEETGHEDAAGKAHQAAKALEDSADQIGRKLGASNRPGDPNFAKLDDNDKLN